MFHEKTVRPVKFKYAGRVHVVSKILYTWVTREGSYPVHHFNVLTEDDDQFHVALRTYQMDWSVSAVDESAAG